MHKWQKSAKLFTSICYRNIFFGTQNIFFFVQQSVIFMQMYKFANEYNIGNVNNVKIILINLNFFIFNDIYLVTYKQ